MPCILCIGYKSELDDAKAANNRNKDRFKIPQSNIGLGIVHIGLGFC